MWVVVAGFSTLQLWVLMGLLPATVGGLVAWIWAGLAALTLVAGIIALRRHPDAGALLLSLVFPVTLIPPFVFGRGALPLLAQPLVQAAMGLTLAVGLIAIVLARREALAPSPRRSTLNGAMEHGSRRGQTESRLAALVLAALWLALPLRALLDPSLLDGTLAAAAPLRAKEKLLLVSWATASVIALAGVLPGLGSRSFGASYRSPWIPAFAGAVLAAVWGVLLWTGA
jgi:hypothetical protein